MTIDHFYKCVVDLANKDQKGFISPDQLNSFIPEAQLTVARKYLNAYLENIPSTSDGQSGANQMPKELLPLLKKELVTPIAGTFPYPADYWQWTSLDYVSGGELRSIVVLDAK